jgi:hypothetical protein
MPGFRPIQIIPPGLLGALQLKQDGRGIVELFDTLQGTMELFDWYMQARAEWRTTLTGLTINASGRLTFAAFSPNSIVVPDREYWYVEQYSITALPQPGAGTAVLNHFATAMVQQATGTQRPLSLGDAINGEVIDTANHLAVVAARGFFAPSGSILGFSYGCAVSAGGTIDFNAFLRYTVLPI